MRLRVFQRLDERKISSNFFWSGRLEEERMVGCRGLRVTIRNLCERCRRNCGCGEGGRRVEVLGEGAAEVDDGPSRIHGDACEERKVFAAMGVSCEMGDRRVCQEDQ